MRVTEPYTIFLRKLPSGKEVYYYQFRYDDGRRSSARSTGCTTKAAARRYCQKIYNEGRFLKQSEITFGDYTKDFFSEQSNFRKWKKANGRDLKAETVRRYNLSLEKHLIPFFSGIPLKRINNDMCKKWVIWASEKLSPKSVNSAQGVLNLIFEAAIDEDLIDRNPLRRLGTRKVKKRHRELLTIGEIRSLYSMDWPSENEKNAFLLTAITGMRIGEVCGLTNDCIYDSFIEVKRTYSDKYGLQDSTKTGVARYVPVPKDFPFQLRTGLVFDTKPHSVYNAFTRRLDKLGIDRKARGITIHSMRDFFVSYLRSRNVSDPKIRAVVGHADSSMTDLYTYWKPDMFPEVYEAQLELYNAITKET